MLVIFWWIKLCLVEDYMIRIVLLILYVKIIVVGMIFMIKNRIDNINLGVIWIDKIFNGSYEGFN